ncbi:hypothetical protein FKM82_009946 [Ascaphus truei]
MLPTLLCPLSLPFWDSLYLCLQQLTVCRGHKVPSFHYQLVWSSTSSHFLLPCQSLPGETCLVQENHSSDKLMSGCSRSP